MSPRAVAVAVVGAGLSLVLAGCAQTTVIREPARRPTTAARPPAPAPAAKNGEIVVRKGDTLYRIASAHRVSALDLAVWNRIPPPYTIYPGQRLRLSPAEDRPMVAEPPVTVGTVPAAKPSGNRPPTSGDIATRPAAGSKPPGSGAATAPATSGTVATGKGGGKPGVTTGTAGTAKGPTTTGGAPAAGGTTPAGSTTGARPGLVSRPGSKVPVVDTPGRPALPAPAVALTWRWPAEGQIANRFQPDDPTRQGVDITGKGGSPVRAAADGVVVYSGAGLVGYGELVIVKHNDQWLSAYGHNRARLVNEGQLVKAGQQIAEMGRSGASRDLLHFEIRFNGKPVDPLTLLPKR